MNTTTLNNFLIDDVKKLIDAIKASAQLQFTPTPGANFETLGDFVLYWSMHINKLDK